MDHVFTIAHQPERNLGQTNFKFETKKKTIFEQYFFHKNCQGGSFNGWMANLTGTFAELPGRTNGQPSRGCRKLLLCYHCSSCIVLGPARSTVFVVCSIVLSRGIILP